MAEYHHEQMCVHLSVKQQHDGAGVDNSDSDSVLSVSAFSSSLKELQGKATSFRPACVPLFVALKPTVYVSDY